MVWYGMVRYVSKHKHKDNVGTFVNGLSVLEPFECVSSASGSYGSVWQTREAGQHKPICMHGMSVSIVGNVWERYCLGAFWERLEASGNVLERFGTFECV